LPAVALQFPLAHPAVVSVIPGMGDPVQVQQIFDWMETPIPEGLWRDLRSAELLHPQAPTPMAQFAA
jgi:D-threo-aldose 1-dehydrogenase